MEADHTLIVLDDENKKYFGGKDEIGLSGKVQNKETGISEEYNYEYSKLPNGQIITSKLESSFSDGNNEIVERSFDENGKVIMETDIVNGELTRDVLFNYDKNGEPLHATVRKYEEGKITEEKDYKSHHSTGGTLSIIGSGQGRLLMGKFEGKDL